MYTARTMMPKTYGFKRKHNFYLHHIIHALPLRQSHPKMAVWHFINLVTVGPNTWKLHLNVVNVLPCVVLIFVTGRKTSAVRIKVVPCSRARSLIVCVCRVFFRDDGCDGKTTLGVTAELYCDQHVDVYVGMPCSAGSQPYLIMAALCNRGPLYF